MLIHPSAVIWAVAAPMVIPQLFVFLVGHASRLGQLAPLPIILQILLRKQLKINPLLQNTTFLRP
jgi:hypothetical protein